MDNLTANRSNRGRSLNFNRGEIRPRMILLAWSIVLAALPSAFAQQAAVNRSEPASGQLQSLVNATAKQFQIAYRHNETEQTLRRKQLAAAVKSWRDATRSEANNQRLAQWLRDAIRNSMPGSREALPPLPEFDRAAIVLRPISPTTTGQTPVTPNQLLPGESTPAGESLPTTTSEPTTEAPLTGDEDEGPSATDFWSEHPAAGELPADLTGGDPFRDDP